MKRLDEAQIVYFRDVLGIGSVLLPTSPFIETRVTGDRTTASLICTLLSTRACWPLEGEVRELAHKMVQAMRLSIEDVFWVEWLTCQEAITSTGTQDVESVAAPVAHAIDAAIKDVSIPVLCFGTDAGAVLAGTSVVPGQWVDWRGRRMLVTHALADLLARSELKKEAWIHLQELMKVIE